MCNKYYFKVLSFHNATMNGIELYEVTLYTDFYN